MKITDLAEANAPGMATIEIGIRPGEKVHECMITSEDARHTVDIGEYYVIKPQVCSYASDLGKPVGEDFEYNSGTNTRWLTVNDLRVTLREQGFNVPEAGA
jgi:UDP-N-acetylglucosamine 4,6-dehydratase